MSIYAEIKRRSSCLLFLLYMKKSQHNNFWTKTWWEGFDHGPGKSAEYSHEQVAKVERMQQKANNTEAFEFVLPVVSQQTRSSGNFEFNLPGVRFCRETIGSHLCTTTHTHRTQRLVWVTRCDSRNQLQLSTAETRTDWRSDRLVVLDVSSAAIFSLRQARAAQ